MGWVTAACRSGCADRESVCGRDAGHSSSPPPTVCPPSARACDFIAKGSGLTRYGGWLHVARLFVTLATTLGVDTYLPVVCALVLAQRQPEVRVCLSCVCMLIATNTWALTRARETGSHFPGGASGSSFGRERRRDGSWREHGGLLHDAAGAV